MGRWTILTLQLLWAYRYANVSLIRSVGSFFLLSRKYHST